MTYYPGQNQIHVKRVNLRIRWLSEEDTEHLIEVWKRHGDNSFAARDIRDIFPRIETYIRHMSGFGIFVRIDKNSTNGWTYKISSNIRARLVKTYGEIEC